MRNYSKKRQKRNREVRDGRMELIASVGYCEMCGSKQSDNPIKKLCVHEIANGPNRAKALDKRFACLVLCVLCNCNDAEDKKLWPEARQLWLLQTYRPMDYDLKAYNELINPSAPNRILQSEVDNYF